MEQIPKLFELIYHQYADFSNNSITSLEDYKPSSLQ